MDDRIGKLFRVKNGEAVTLFVEIGSGKGELLDVPNGTLVLILGTSHRLEYDISKVLVNGKIYEAFDKHFYNRAVKVA